MMSEENAIWNDTYALKAFFQTAGKVSHERFINYTAIKQFFVLHG